ncbi:hypothetical protein BGZ61DRAFT_237152 [Ilyonectria robusta]|uniref:uncharacterized protein n=1 Tax=Ilyonectria robusta TaxID=1079257 RepID=UPI001E8D4612|nr:uncharacterized protein BGZ61DRAFT_237152 [Ilyonectria robusta]KAH8699780.1 hypothetical protein BGZ61DRAFT_237152 [Ilyonectria robusta]
MKHGASYPGRETLATPLPATFNTTEMIVETPRALPIPTTHTGHWRQCVALVPPSLRPRGSTSTRPLLTRCPGRCLPLASPDRQTDERLRGIDVPRPCQASIVSSCQSAFAPLIIKASLRPRQARTDNAVCCNAIVFGKLKPPRVACDHPKSVPQISPSSCPSRCGFRTG